MVIYWISNYSKTLSITSLSTKNSSVTPLSQPLVISAGLRSFLVLVVYFISPPPLLVKESYHYFIYVLGISRVKEQESWQGVCILLWKSRPRKHIRTPVSETSIWISIRKVLKRDAIALIKEEEISFFTFQKIYLMRPLKLYNGFEFVLDYIVICS